MTLTELRDALAAATGPDRRLDGELFRHLGGKKFQRAFWDAKATSPRGSSDKHVSDKASGYSPAYTASIDAAVTLVRYGERQTIGDLLWHVGEWRDMARCRLGNNHHQAATPALALCLARIEYELAKGEGPIQCSDVGVRV